GINRAQHEIAVALQPLQGLGAHDGKIRARASGSAGYLNVYPRSSALRGTTRWPVTTTLAASPSTRRKAKPGVFRNDGRPSTLPSARLKSRLVTGWGPVPLRGPVQAGVSRAKRNSPHMSS